MHVRWASSACQHPAGAGHQPRYAAPASRACTGTGQIEPRPALVLGHGAAGSVDAPDLRAVTAVEVGVGVSVALAAQPYRVAGRRSAVPVAQLDAAWVAVIDYLRAAELAGLAIITGGRSSGSRVACRIAAATGAVAVLCLAFAVHSPRCSRTAEQKPRQRELDARRGPGPGRPR